MIPSFLDPSHIRAAIDGVKSSYLAGKLFGGHFIIGPNVRQISGDWSKTELAGLVISAHPQVSIVTATGGGVQAALIGNAYFWREPLADNTAVLQELLGVGLAHLPEATAGLSGRWVILASDGARSIIFGDAWGSYPVFYDASWIASSPKLVAFDRLDDLDMPFVQQIVPRVLAGGSGGQYPFGRTPYVRVSHLLPNHFLDLATRRSARFWPTHQLDCGLDISEQASTMFAGSIRAIGARDQVAFGLTGGTDSRLVYAAALASGLDFKTYTWQMPGAADSDDHFDVTISERIAGICGTEHLKFRADTPSPEVQDLLDACSHMPSPANHRLIGAFLEWPLADRLQLVGLGSEINRRFWDIADRDNPFFNDFLGCLGFGGSSYAADLIRPWVEDAHGIQRQFGLQPFDLMYWEGRLARWAADNLCDMNLVQRSIPAFNCREWFELVLGATQSRSSRTRSIYYQMTKRLEPRIADLPINPFPLKHRLRKLRRELPKALVRTALMATGQYGRIRRRRSL